VLLSFTSSNHSFHPSTSQESGINCLQAIRLQLPPLPPPFQGRVGPRLVDITPRYCPPTLSATAKSGRVHIGGQPSAQCAGADGGAFYAKGQNLLAPTGRATGTHGDLDLIRLPPSARSADWTVAGHCECSRSGARSGRHCGPGDASWGVGAQTRQAVPRRQSPPQARHLAAALTLERGRVGGRRPRTGAGHDPVPCRAKVLRATARGTVR
jgi:hypothetical protein